MARQAIRRQRVSFGEVVRLAKQRCDPVAAGLERFVGLEHLEPGDMRIRSWGKVADGTTFTNRFAPGQVLFGKRRAYQRKIAVADFEGVCSGDIYVLESVDPNRLLPGLVPYICLTDRFFEHAVGTSAGSLSPRTNWKSLATFDLQLPPPDEQRALLAKLDALRRALESFLLLGTRADELAVALCADMVQASRWRKVRVGGIAKFTSGKSIPVTNLPSEATPEANVPVYGGNGMTGYTRSCLPGVEAPTVVVGRVGQFCGVTHLTPGRAWITDNALYPVHVDESITMEFLAICLRGANLNRGKLGEYLPLVTQAVVHETQIPLPPKSEQTSRVEAYQQTQQAADLARERAASLIAVRAAVLNCF